MNKIYIPVKSYVHNKLSGIFICSFLLMWMLPSVVNAQVYRASASAGTTATSLTITKPLNTMSGDVMIAAIGIRSSTATITPPTGWALIRRTDNATGSANAQALYWKAAGSAEPASYAWTFNVSVASSGGIMSFYNVSSSAPTLSSGAATVSALTHTATAVTTTVANNVVITAHSFGSAATWVSPTGMAETVDRASVTVPNAAGQSIQMNYVVQAAIGSTGTKTATASANANTGVAQMVALVPLACTTPAAPTVTSPVTYCQNSTAVQLTATGSNLIWGTGGSATSPTPATTSAGTINYFVRQVVSGCTSPQATIAVVVNAAPTTANAGPDQTGASTCGLTTVTLAGNTPAAGTGTWSIISGTGGVVNTPASATSTFSGTAGSTYTLRRTISNNPCAASTDDVVITFNQNSAATISYSGSPYCSNTGTAIVTLTGTAGGTYSSTAGLVINGTTGDITLGTSTPGTYTVTYTMVNGPCTTTATTSVTVFAGPSASISYSGNPYCSSSGTATITQTGTAGGTYSSTAGLSINSATGAVNLGASSAGTYTVAYTVAASGGCLVYTTTTSITITIQPYVTGNYAGNPYCTNFGIAYPTGAKAGADGVLTSTAGLSINSSNGVIDLAQSTPGNYTITYSVAPSGGCNLYEATYNLVIIASPSATISYPASSFCANAGLIAVTRTGTAGGIYTSAAGLSINASTGEINANASTPGSYTVTYSIAASGSCSAFTTTTSITITAIPSASISYTASPYCSNAGTASVTRTGTAGGSYSSTAGLTINGSTGEVTLASSTAGTYTVTYTVAASGGCALYTATTVITVSALPTATISYAAGSYCSNGGTATVTRSGTTGGTYSSTAGLTINGTTGDITLASSIAGIYTVTYTMVNGGCTTTATNSVTVTAAPSASITYSGNPYCSNSGTATVTQTGTAGGTYSSTGGLTINGTTGDITLASSTAGTYTVTYTVAASAGCAAYANTTSVSITAAPSATISYSGSPYCSNSGTAAVTRTGTTGGTYSSTAGLAINGTTGNITLGTSTAGTYTVTYTMVNGPCTTTATTSVIVFAGPSAVISYSGNPYCSSSGNATITQTGTGGGTYSSTAGLSINSATGAVNLGASTAGTYAVTYTVAASGGCLAYATTTGITITTQPYATGSYAGNPYCTNYGIAYATGSKAGADGVLTSTAGLSINSSNGVINLGLSTPGNYTITYSVAASGGCADYATTYNLVIIASPSATISYSAASFCANAGLIAVTRTGTAGGIYTSAPGLSINASTGEINANASTPGSYTVTYSIAASGSCSAFTTTTSITITAIPSASISYTASPYCSNAGTASVTRTGTAGGSYSSTAGLTINGSTGEVTLASSTAGTYTVTYTVAASGGCALYTATTAITVSAPSAATISYAAGSYCSNGGTATITRSGTAGGAYSSTAGLTINGATGDITLASSIAGTYTVTYTMVNGGCTTTATTSVTVTVVPSASISYGANPYCSNSGTATVTRSGTAGGTYSSTAGLTINGTTGEITLPSSTAGTYTVTYTVAASAGCAAYTTTTVITVTAAPIATISYSGSPYCTTSGSVTVTRTGTSGGTYSSTAGLSVNASTGAVNLGASIAGTYTVTYTVAASGGCAVYTATTSIQFAPISNNQLNFTNGLNGVICATPGEGGTATLTAPAGTIFTTVGFASYGTPGGSCSAFTLGSCNALNSQSIAEGYLLGTNTGSIPATNVVFGDPCSGTGKRLYVQATYTQPICSGTSPGVISGTSPTGGNGIYTYLWEKSITGSSSGFVAAPGSNTSVNYDPGVLTETTWFRRTVSSNGCSNSRVILVTVTPLPVATIAYSGTPFCSGGGTVAVTRTGTAGGTYSSTAGLSINASTGAISPSASTAGTYTVTYTIAAAGGCSALTATANVTITAAPAASITYTGSPYCSIGGKASVTFSGTAGGTYSSTAGLQINSSTGAINLGTSTPGSYTVTYTILASGGCSQYQAAASITLYQAGTWTGAISTDWNNAANWLCGGVPVVLTDVVIPTGLTNYPSITTGVSPVHNLTLQTGSSLIVSAAVLQVSGSVTNNGTFTSTLGSIEMNGVSAQVIPSLLFAGNLVKDLTINNAAGVTLGGTLNLTGALTISNGQFNTGNNLVLKSSATATARVAQITSNAVNPIVGNVTVERYVPGRRKYRLITSSVTTSASPVLTAGQESLSIWGNWQNQGINNVPNVGTIITGGTVAQGFDPQTSNGSLFTYNDTTRRLVGFSSANGKNTKYTPLKAGVAYFMFVYGDRRNSIVASNPNPTVLRAKGTLLTGNQYYDQNSATPLINVPGRYTFMGNPFASPIDWSTMPKTDLANTYWGYDPNLSTTGGYVTVSTLGTQTIVSPRSGTIGINRYIQSGQGFFVRTTGTSPSLTIREQDKAANFNGNAFRDGGNKLPLLAINLLYDSGPNKILTDGTVAAFDPAFSNELGSEDAAKMINGAEVIAIAKGAELLSVEARKMPAETDTLFLNVFKITRPKYTLQIFAEHMENSGVLPYLEDSYLKTSSPLSLTDTNRIVFSVLASNAASSHVNRFRIVFKQVSPLPVNFTFVSAVKKDKNIQVSWKVALETGIKKYEVEQSADGLNFTKAAEVNTSGNNGSAVYQWIDINAATGNNYYRVRAVQHDVAILLSKVVVVKVEAARPSITVYPNPGNGSRFNLQLNDLDKGRYTLLLFNSNGQQILTQVIDHVGGTLIKVIIPNQKLPAGIYYVSVQNSDTQYRHDIYIE